MIDASEPEVLAMIYDEQHPWDVRLVTERAEIGGYALLYNAANAAKGGEAVTAYVCRSMQPRDPGYAPLYDEQHPPPWAIEPEVAPEDEE